MVNKNAIGNKIKRVQVYNKLKKEKDAKRAERIKRKRQRENGELTDVIKKRSIDDLREYDETILQKSNNEYDQVLTEIKNEEAHDEFSSYFNKSLRPKIVITTSERATKRLYTFVKELLHVFPNSYFFPRKTYSIKEMISSCINPQKKQKNHILIY